MSNHLSRILYVEDDPGIRHISRIALEGLGGFKVTAFGSGPEAIAAAPALKPDLVLLDAAMPGMDGPATLKAMRDSFAIDDIPVIFMAAAHDRPEDIARYEAMGALGVIRKPFDPVQVSEQICRIWYS